MTIDHLTRIPGVQSRVDAVPGMAHFRGSGPPGTECRSCFFYGSQPGPRPRRIPTFEEYRSKRCGNCLKYEQLMSQRGPKVHGSNASCRYYKEGGTR
jgi:hypothetical protein